MLKTISNVIMILSTICWATVGSLDAYQAEQKKDQLKLSFKYRPNLDECIPSKPQQKAKRSAVDEYLDYLHRRLSFPKDYDIDEDKRQIQKLTDEILSELTWKEDLAFLNEIPPKTQQIEVKPTPPTGFVLDTPGYSPKEKVKKSDYDLSFLDEIPPINQPSSYASYAEEREIKKIKEDIENAIRDLEGAASDAKRELEEQRIILDWENFRHKQELFNNYLEIKSFIEYDIELDLMLSKTFPKYKKYSTSPYYWLWLLYLYR